MKTKVKKPVAKIKSKISKKKTPVKKKSAFGGLSKILFSSLPVYASSME